MASDITQLVIGSNTYNLRDNSKLPLTGGTITGSISANDNVHIGVGTTTGNYQVSNYLSAGAGYSENSGLYGVK